jgi:hypothetical protein
MGYWVRIMSALVFGDELPDMIEIEIPISTEAKDITAHARGCWRSLDFRLKAGARLRRVNMLAPIQRGQASSEFPVEACKLSGSRANLAVKQQC